MFLDRGEAAPAVRCAFWLGMSLVLRGEHARGGSDGPAVVLYRVHTAADAVPLDELQALADARGAQLPC